MGNADSFATGGLNSAIGPVLMRRITPLSTQIQDIATLKAENYQDNIFGSVAGRLENISFQLKAPVSSKKLGELMKNMSTR